MTEILLSWFHGLPPELTSFLLASLPLTESRLAMPVALFVFHLSPFATFVWTYFGNLLPVPVLYAVLPPVIKFFTVRSPFLDRWVNGWFETLRTKHREGYAKWGAVFLFIVVAAPGPGTGIWTATVLGILFHVKWTYAVVAIAAGLFVASLTILALMLGVFEGAKLL